MWKGKRGLVVTAGTDFIGLSSLYIFLLQEVAAPAFSRSRIQLSFFSLSITFSLFLSCFPRCTVGHLHSPAAAPFRALRIYFNALSPPSLSCILSIAHPLFALRNQPLPTTLHRLFICDSTFYTTGRYRVGTLCSLEPPPERDSFLPPNGRLKSGEDVRNGCPAAVIKGASWRWKNNDFRPSMVFRIIEEYGHQSSIWYVSFLFFFFPFVLNLVRCSIMQLSRLDGGFIELAHELRSISFPFDAMTKA